MSGWRQVGISLWEIAVGSRAAVAMFAKTVDQEPFSDLSFEYPEDEDGLGFAIVELSSGALVAVIDDPGNLIKGAVLYRVGDVDDQIVLQDFMNDFEISISDVKWVSGGR
ncbi:hypothetical protein ACWGKU_20230 [Kitasatospora sp. NPDC054768]